MTGNFTGGDFNAARQQAQAAIKAAFENDFCPWAKSNKSNLAPQLTSASHFAPMMKDICPNF